MNLIPNGIPDVEKQSDESTGKKREYHPFRQYTEIKRWKTGADSELEDEEINHEVQSDWSHLRFSFDHAEAVSNSTSPQFDASQGQSG